jgi:hypothetical protein
MKLSLYTKRVSIYWQFLDAEFMDGDGARTIGLHLKFWKFERGWFLRFCGDLHWAKVRYDYIWNGRRSSWTVQSPVHYEKYNHGN